MPSFYLNLTGIELKQNVPGVETPILIYTVPAGGTVLFPKITRILMKLYCTDGNEFDKGDVFQFYYKTPAMKNEKPLTEHFTYHMFQILSLKDQTDSAKTQTISMDRELLQRIYSMGGEEGVRFTKDRQIILKVLSSKTFDPNNPDNYLELKDVEVISSE